MGALVWTMVGLALWHFTVFVPDRFWGGIVGAFLAALLGSIVSGLAIHGLAVPGRDDTDLVTALEAIPGTLVALALAYAIGSRRERVRPA